MSKHIECTCEFDAQSDDPKHIDPECPDHGLHSGYAVDVYIPNVRTSRTCLIENLGNLPYAKAASDLAKLELPRLTDGSDVMDVGDVGEVEFLDIVSQWVIAYEQVDSIAKAKVAEMATELNDYRTFGTVLRRLVKGEN